MSQFWKKYKLYIIIGIVLGVVLGLAYYWFLVRNRPATEDTITKVNAPFETQNGTVLFSGYADDIEIAPTLEIYKTSKPEITRVESFVSRFSKAAPAIGEDVYFWNLPGCNISYTPTTSLLFLNSEKGLVTDVKIATKPDIKSFLLDYLNIKDIEITEIEELGNGRNEYKGYFVYQTLQYGSLYLDGYAINMISDNSKIYSLSILLLTKDNVVPYQQMPTISLQDTLPVNKDIYTKYISYDENYKKQFPIIQASAKLKSVEIQSASYKYVYLDSNYGYILPVYEVAGNGLLIDSQKKEYWANVLIYTCVFDRTHINEVKAFLENTILLDQAY